MEQYKNVSDEDLIARLRNGESGISDYLMEKYKGLVKQKARAMFLIGGDNDDLIQEGMIGLFKAVQDYQPEKEASFQTFARICIDRQIYNAIKSSNRQKHQPLNTYVSLSAKDDENTLDDIWAQSPETIVIDQENRRLLEEEIFRSLSSMEKKVLEYYLEGCSYVEISRLLDKSPKSIDNALQRIKTKIREQIS